MYNGQAVSVGTGSMKRTGCIGDRVGVRRQGGKGVASPHGWVKMRHGAQYEEGGGAQLL